MTTIQTGQGMILTTRVIPKGQQQVVEIWVATENGPKRLLTPIEPATCFVAQKDAYKLNNLCAQQQLRIEIAPLELTTFTHEKTCSVKCQQDRQLGQLRRLCEDHQITLYETDIKTPDRYLMERFVTNAIHYQGRQGTNAETILDCKVKPVGFRCPLGIVSIDIECNENGELFSIGIASPDLNVVLMIGNLEPEWLETSDFKMIPCENETDLLSRFIKLLTEHDPDIIIGWNIKQFDLPVLAQAARRCGIPLNIGRQLSTAEVRVFEDGRAIVDLPGRVLIDGIEALKTMTFQFDSFALDNVASHLLGKQKLINSPDKLEEIKRLFKEDKIALAKYNFQDCVLVNEIFDEVALIDFLTLRSELTGLRLGRPGGSVASFINLYLPKLHRAGYISPLRPENGGLASPGGYVMNSRPGLYNNVLVLDFKSLYPSIIRTFKIDPLGLVEGLSTPDDAIPGFKGAVFHREKHFLPDIITNLWQQRDEAKRNKDKPRSQAIKILMNSFYGVLGSGGCPFYDPRLASSITMRGHEIMQLTAQWVEELGYEVIYGDTDSTFVFIGDDKTQSQALKIGNSLQLEINTRWQQRILEEFNLPCELEIEFETHYERFFMPTIRGSEAGSKKRYAGLIRTATNSEMVFKGLETVRSDWTPLAKDFQQQLYQRVFNGESVDDYITQLVSDVKTGCYDSELIYAKQLRKPLAEYTKSVPPHVKAARLADEQNASLGKPLQYQKRTSIQYVMTLNGPQTLDYQNCPLDYEHYIEKQIRPIAESILPFIKQDFDALISAQLGLF